MGCAHRTICVPSCLCMTYKHNAKYFFAAQAQTCLSCSGIDDPRKCTHTITCDKNEVCFNIVFSNNYWTMLRI